MSPSAPVLYIMFNRPDHVRQSFAAIREARPARLYVAADGPRPDHPSDAERCHECRRLVDEMTDWPCIVEQRYRAANLGVQHGVVDAIDWFFGTEESGIILEDDVVGSPAFFRFCYELLKRYRDDPCVGTIGGASYAGPPDSSSYRPSHFPDMWGWATWRDRWQDYDGEMTAWPDFDAKGGLHRIAGGSVLFRRRWRKIFTKAKAGGFRAWDYQWILTRWRHGTVSLHPAVPLVENIGFDMQASNTRTIKRPAYVRPMGVLGFPLRHPPALDPDPRTERKMWALRFGISPARELLRAIRSPISRFRRWLAPA